MLYVITNHEFYSSFCRTESTHNEGQNQQTKGNKNNSSCPEEQQSSADTVSASESLPEPPTNIPPPANSPRLADELEGEAEAESVLKPGVQPGDDLPTTGMLLSS